MNWELKTGGGGAALFVYWRLSLLKASLSKENKIFGDVGEEWEVFLVFCVPRMPDIVKEICVKGLQSIWAFSGEENQIA